MVPLGILTAITGAIRIQGSQVAKAFIGRARENKALAEIELMSSTSGEVCEMFNGNSIVRAMGKPKITEFLIFPEKYENLEEKYAMVDAKLKENTSMSDSTPMSEQELEKDDKPDDSCGIESFDSAISEKCNLMECKRRNESSSTAASLIPEHIVYQSQSTIWIQKQFAAVKAIVESCQPNSDVEEGNITIAKECEPPEGSPNLQLNLSSDYSDQMWLKKGRETAVAALIGVILQLGLVTIAAAMAFYLKPTSSSLFETKDYGFPCYVAGTVLLSVGTGLCSFIVERSTIEHSLEVVDTSKKDKPFSLLWVQRHQTVNDQTFNGYVILAGKKRRVITSRQNNTDESQQSKAEERLWQLVTLGAAGSAGIGFVAQFMGLRGLAFPCSIAQMGSIILMALVRAWVRRRLGRLPVNRVALAGYELDFLATHITFNPEFREFQWCKKKPQQPFGKQRAPTEFCRWGINTQDPKKPDISPKRSKDHVSILSPVSGSHPCSLPSSQQLLRVRERLGNLCRWKSKSSESAKSLALSIEHFMDIFFPSIQGAKGIDKDELRSLTWYVNTTRLSDQGVHLEKDNIRIRLERNPKGKWRAELGVIDAAMSLWMAAIEAKKLDQEQAENKKPSDDSSTWRRTQYGDDLTCEFGRIVGENLKGGVLKRDLSWWIGDMIASQCDPKGQDRSASRGTGNKSSTIRSKGHWSDGLDLVIGFKDESGDADACEFGIISTGRLPSILAQHLFTSFIRKAAKHLPRGFLLQPGPDDLRQVTIERVHRFDSQDFAQNWLRPRLHHRQLSDCVDKMASHGLGSVTEILLCIIPTLSQMGLLPNQEILGLMPRIRNRHNQPWVEVAMCFKELLQRVQIPSGEKVEKLTAAAIIHAMDFLSFAYEPYNESPKLSDELDSEIEQIVTKLVSPELSIAMKKIAPFYCLQLRSQNFINMFQQFSKLTEINKFVEILSESHEKFEEVERRDAPTESSDFLDKDFATEALGFTEKHFDLIAPIGYFGFERFNRARMFEKNKGLLGGRDVFGWTALHYWSVSREYYPSHELSSASKSGRLLEVRDSFGRTIMHTTAAISHKTSHSFYRLLEEQSTNSAAHGMYQTGLDGMTPLHLLSKSGAINCIKLLRDKLGESMRDTELVLKKDLWGRQALHIACKFGHDEIATELLKMGARSDQFDDFEKSPVDYFLNKRKAKRSGNPDEEQNDERPTPSELHNIEKPLSDGDREMFLKLSPNPDTKYQHGKTLMHIAVDIGDENTVAELHRKHFEIDAQDENGRSPLHYAINASQIAIAKSLMDNFKADATLKDSQGMTALLLSASLGLEEMVKFLVRIPRSYDLSEKDSHGYTALHLSILKNRQDVAMFLLGFDQKEDDLFADDRQSLLITACREGLSWAVPKILCRWPQLIDKSGQWDQPPISWACEEGHDEIVKQLIDHLEKKPDEKPNVLNQTATRWFNYTPLHFAAKLSDSKCLSHLLAQDSVKFAPDEDGKKPLQLAIEGEHMDNLQMLLLDKRTPPEERIKHAKEFVASPPSDEFGSIVSDILQSLTEKGLDGFLLWLLEKISNINSESPIGMLASNWRQEPWERFKSPWELASLYSHAGFKKTIESYDGDKNGLDEDGWSCVDYVKSFNRAGTFNGLLDYLERHTASISSPKFPTGLVGKEFQQTVKIGVRVVQEDDNVTKVCLRSDHCISARDDYFYFEVRITNEAPCRWLGIGFCERDTEQDQMPGWFERSWAYHVDDGRFFINSDDSFPSSDFGDRGLFGSYFVLGACLNMKTGQGFCTRNGKRLDMGGAFSSPDERFSYGKLYPCVGFDVSSEGVGLDFEVNFDGSGQHAFEYKGPFTFD
ncbi:Ankyrin-1 [Fusarium oxysporum f. sp. conglutinans]|nr:Ankyrin-1 [Fusarium oxysporum f. sp. conglutinans]